jgi:hypothetical protein
MSLAKLPREKVERKLESHVFDSPSAVRPRGRSGSHGMRPHLHAERATASVRCRCYHLDFALTGTQIDSNQHHAHLDWLLPLVDDNISRAATPSHW